MNGRAHARVKAPTHARMRVNARIHYSRDGENDGKCEGAYTISKLHGNVVSGISIELHPASRAIDFYGPNKHKCHNSLVGFR